MFKITQQRFEEHHTKKSGRKRRKTVLFSFHRKNCFMSARAINFRVVFRNHSIILPGCLVAWLTKKEYAYFTHIYNWICDRSAFFPYICSICNAHLRLPRYASFRLDVFASAYFSRFWLCLHRWLNISILLFCSNIFVCVCIANALFHVIYHQDISHKLPSSRAAAAATPSPSPNYDHTNPSLLFAMPKPLLHMWIQKNENPNRYR